MMPRFQLFWRTALASMLLVAFGLGAAPADTTLPFQVSGDVAESFQLLTSTYYERVDPQALLAAAADALATTARKHGVTISPPALHVEGDRDATLAELESAIATAARTAHASSSDFAYAAIDGMAKATNDRYTQFFTPAEFKAFNEALDPRRIGGIGVMIEPDASTGCVRVSYVLPGTPAERAGLRVGDVIAAVDGFPTKGLTVEAVSGRLRGKAGTAVSVSVQRSPAPQTFAITREDV
ncbi:MAG: PDZ domain-containing protein, partial [Candidatus Eremiobacteraeota bacterium]|nr:PDZ domain-containing protein [Candidatus Eremiobacteraeota bacterium]